MRQVLGAGALGRPRGMGWGGRLEGGSGWGTHVTPWLIHVNVWQKPLQYCKVISLQLIKMNGKKKKKFTLWYYDIQRLSLLLPALFLCHRCLPHMHTHEVRNIHTQTHIHTHTQLHPTHMHTCTDTHTNTHSHTHTPFDSSFTE